MFEAHFCQLVVEQKEIAKLEKFIIDRVELDLEDYFHRLKILCLFNLRYEFEDPLYNL